MQVETLEEYDEYCHYVAGLIGYGLSRLFHAAGLEDLAPDNLSNSMGLFLQVCLRLLYVLMIEAFKILALLFIAENKHYKRLLGGYQRNSKTTHVLA